MDDEQSDLLNYFMTKGSNVITPPNAAMYARSRQYIPTARDPVGVVTYGNDPYGFAHYAAQQVRNDDQQRAYEGALDRSNSLAAALSQETEMRKLAGEILKKSTVDPTWAMRMSGFPFTETEAARTLVGSAPIKDYAGAVQSAAAGGADISSAFNTGMGMWGLPPATPMEPTSVQAARFGGDGGSGKTKFTGTMIGDAGPGSPAVQWGVSAGSADAAQEGIKALSPRQQGVPPPRSSDKLTPQISPGVQARLDQAKRAGAEVVGYRAEGDHVYVEMRMPDKTSKLFRIYPGRTAGDGLPFSEEIDLTKGRP